MRAANVSVQHISKHCATRQTSGIFHGNFRHWDETHHATCANVFCGSRCWRVETLPFEDERDGATFSSGWIKADVRSRNLLALLVPVWRLRYTKPVTFFTLVSGDDGAAEELCYSRLKARRLGDCKVVPYVVDELENFASPPIWE